MSVAGIDFGNLSLLIALAGKGGVDVILNDSSNRQTATAVSIQGKQRFIGDSGAAMVSLSNLNLFLFNLIIFMHFFPGSLKHHQHCPGHENADRQALRRPRRAAGAG
ncbi:hypothetical protein EON64_07865 [archaeon]|nr:MAG: hypothetical protein EON64_07865 [archaeon]